MKLIKKLTNLKDKLFFLLALSAVNAVNLMAETQDILGGTKVREQATATIQAWMWLVPIGIFVVALGFTVWEYKKIRKTDADDRDITVTPKQVIIKLLTTFLVTSFILYIILFVFSYLFLGISAGDTWQTFVTKPLKALLGIK